MSSLAVRFVAQISKQAASLRGRLLLALKYLVESAQDGRVQMKRLRKVLQ